MREAFIQEESDMQMMREAFQLEKVNMEKEREMFSKDWREHCMKKEASDAEDDTMIDDREMFKI